MQRIGLYYPYVHFRNERWIKAAALYWPGLARVVSPGFPVTDPDLVTALRDGLDGFVTDVDPREAAAAVAPAFLKAVEGRDLYLPGHFIASQPRKDRIHITQKPSRSCSSSCRSAPKAAPSWIPSPASVPQASLPSREGRQFVGGELSAHYADVAEARLRAELTQDAFVLAGPEA